MSSSSDSNDDNGFKTSAFVKFSGNDYYDVHFKDVEKINYKYNAELEKGTITLSLIINDKEIWSSGKLIGTNNNSGDILVNSGDQVKLRVIGKKATGTYKFEWEGN